MSATTSLDHRRFFEHAPDLRPFRGSGLFARIGGEPTVGALVDALYDRFAADDLMRP